MVTRERRADRSAAARARRSEGRAGEGRRIAEWAFARGAAKAAHAPYPTCDFRRGHWSASHILGFGPTLSATTWRLAADVLFAAVPPGEACMPANPKPADAPDLFAASLSATDPEIAEAIRLELGRQR